jgi:superfamily I DNA and/or RNA helicase
VINSLKNFCLKQFSSSLKRYETNKDVPIMKFTKSSIYVITPYNAQKNAIAECFADEGIED